MSRKKIGKLSALKYCKLKYRKFFEQLCDIRVSMSRVSATRGARRDED